MREFSIVAALVARVEEIADENGLPAVKEVHVSIGELSDVDPARLASAYRLVREGTVCETAELVVARVPIRWRCRGCGAEIAAPDAPRCKRCGGFGRLTSGDEVLLEKVEWDGALVPGPFPR